MPCLTVGLDLGQAQDYTALVVVERVIVLPMGISIVDYHRNPSKVAAPDVHEEHHVLALKRWELGTSYSEIVKDLIGVFTNDELSRDANLAVDRSGVGRAVVDMLAEHRWELGQLYSHHRWITVTASGPDSKTNLVDGLLIPLEQGRVRVPDHLPLAPAMEKELTAFTRKISVAGNTTFDFNRSGEGHGDLVSSLMLALHCPNRMRSPRLIENPSTSNEWWRNV